MQNYRISKLKETRDLKIAKNFSKNLIDELNKEIEFECCKRDKMIQIAMHEQSRNKGNDCVWGSISINDDLHQNPPQTPSGISKISGLSQQLEMLMYENESLEEDNYNLQEDLMQRDESICNLQKKISELQQQICKISKANNELECRIADTQREHKEKQRLRNELNQNKRHAASLNCQIQNIEKYIKELRSEFECLKKDKEMFGEHVNIENSNCNKNQNGKEDYMKQQYESLLQEYCKKDKEYKEVTNRLKKCIKNNENDMEKAENEALRKESEKLISEIEDYRVLIKELQSQIELYRDKFMKAQEKVECQRLKIEKLDRCKSSIECQVNEEIERIKEKFQEKLNELCPYPEKYAESRNELEKAKSHICILENNLKDVTNELWKAKCELKNLKDQPHDSIVEKYEKLQIELEEEQKKYCGLKKTKECLEEKLNSMKEELDSLRKDSAKIITTTKCTADKNRQTLHEQINCLEFELAQCRASASLSLSEKQEIIKQLKQELNTLCGLFNSSQGQIKQLKDQIDYLTQQRYKDVDKNIDCYELFSNK